MLNADAVNLKSPTTDMPTKLKIKIMINVGEAWRRIGTMYQKPTNLANLTKT
jgi:hypothetical protein